jgi:hypothetical protein
MAGEIQDHGPYRVISLRANQERTQRWNRVDRAEGLPQLHRSRVRSLHLATQLWNAIEYGMKLELCQRLRKHQDGRWIGRLPLYPE